MANRDALLKSVQRIFDQYLQDCAPAKIGLTRKLVIEQVQNTFGPFSWPTEMDMARFYIQKRFSSSPDFEIIYVEALTKNPGTPQERRPTTEDTIKQALRDHFDRMEGKVLIIGSNQPFVLYQLEVVLGVVRGVCTVEPISDALPHATSDTQVLEAFLIAMRFRCQSALARRCAELSQMAASDSGAAKDGAAEIAGGGAPVPALALKQIVPVIRSIGGDSQPREPDSATNHLSS
jgi:hypothetical protein